METKRLTIDMIKEYIRNNIKSFINEEVITQYIPKKQNIINPLLVEEKKSLQTLLTDDFNTLKIESSYFLNLFQNNLFENFLILNPLYNFSNEDISINKKTLSFYYSVLSSLDVKFHSESQEYKYKSYISLLSYFKKDIMIDGFKEHKYSKLKWNKNHIYKHFEKNTLDDKVIRYVSDALHINIFYIKNDKIYYTGGEFIVFKKIVFLLNYDDTYYLLCDKENKFYIFNNNEYIKSFLKENSNINLVFSESFDPVGTNWNKSIDIQKNQNKIGKIEEITYTDKLNGYDIENTIQSNDEENDKENDEENNEVNDEENDGEIDEEINENLSLIELQKKAKEFKIDIFYNIDGNRKIKNKKQLCIEILKKKKS